jgi:hypothetical protein
MDDPCVGCGSVFDRNDATAAGFMIMVSADAHAIVVDAVARHTEEFSAATSAYGDNGHAVDQFWLGRVHGFRSCSSDYSSIREILSNGAIGIGSAGERSAVV